MSIPKNSKSVKYKTANSSVNLDDKTSSTLFDINEYNQELLNLACYVISALCICILINHYAYRTGKPTCNGYIFNSYLYIILSILIMLITITINHQTHIFSHIIDKILFSDNMALNIGNTILIFLTLIALRYILTYYVKPTDIALNNTIWFIIMFSIGILLTVGSVDLSKINLTPYKVFIALTDIISFSGFYVIIIAIVIGLICYKVGSSITKVNWDLYLSILTYIYIVYLCFGILFITDVGKLSLFIKIGLALGYIYIVLLLVSNHCDIYKKSLNCVENQAIPNYPLDSFNLLYKMRRVVFELINVIYTYFKNKFQE